MVLMLAAAEVAARAFWRVRHAIPLTRPGAILRAFYPQLWDVEWKGEEYRDPLRVLFLGGSVLHPAWGNVEQELREGVALRLRRPVVVFNMAGIGHTSRDSLIKYRALAGTPADLVVVYDGINEARANAVPPERFADDYSHFAWYEIVNATERYDGRALLALPYTLAYLRTRVKERLHLVDYAPPWAPRADWLAYAEDVKTAGPFAANLRAILDIAAARGQPPLLMTFAIHLPGDYTPEAFARRELDYATHLSPVELWGRPEHVARAVARHNEVVRALVAERPGVPLVDQDRLMPRGARWFNDVCHLTGAGSAAFVDNMLDAVVDALRRARP